MVARFRLARDYSQPLVPEMTAISQWPWTLVKVAQLVTTLENVYQRALLLDAPVPPPSVIFNKDAVDKWFEENEKAEPGEP